MSYYVGLVKSFAKIFIYVMVLMIFKVILTLLMLNILGLHLGSCECLWSSISRSDQQHNSPNYSDTQPVFTCFQPVTIPNYYCGKYPARIFRLAARCFRPRSGKILLILFRSRDFSYFFYFHCYDAMMVIYESGIVLWATKVYADCQGFHYHC